MNCRDAAKAIAQGLFDELEPGLRSELEEHLRLCAACARQLKASTRACTEMAELAPVPLPDKVRESLRERVRGAAALPPRAEGPPARPDPEHTMRQKTLIFVTGLAALLLLTVALLYASGKTDEAPPVAGQVTFCAGGVQFRTPGMSRWTGLRDDEVLLEGAAIKTEAGGLARAQSKGVKWWLDELGCLRLPAENEAELLHGRAHAECDGTAPLRLTSANGRVECTKGAFTARLSDKRLQVACTSGEATVVSGDERVVLAAGTVATLVEGEVVGPLRHARPAELRHWLWKFGPSIDGGGLGLRQVAAMPVVGESPALPPQVVMERLDVKAEVRGPLALVRVTASLRNDGATRWTGELSLDDLLMPAPLACVGAGPVELGAGERGEGTCFGLSLMRARDGVYTLALAPIAWTDGRIGQASLSLRASADGGLARVVSPTHELDGEQDQYRWQAEDVQPGQPMLLEFAMAEASGVDAVTLADGERTGAVMAWRPPAEKGPWLTMRDNVFVAFDATADYGAVGRMAAHEFMDVFLTSLPFGCLTSVVGFDGSVKIEPTGLGRHVPARAESMLIGLWKLGGEATPPETNFLRACGALAAGAEGRSYLVFVTGRDAPADVAELRDTLGEADVTVIHVRLGAEGRTGCAALPAGAPEGVSLRSSARLAAWASALDLLSDLAWPVAHNVGVALRGEGTADVLLGTVGFASQPVVALVSQCRDSASLTGVFGAKLGSEDVQAPFAVLAGDRPDVEGKEAQALLAALRQVLAE